MQIVRSILAIVFGAAVAMGLVAAGDALSHVLYRPAETTVEELIKTRQENPQKWADSFKDLPIEALLVMVAGWTLAAFLGGLVAALIAGRARCWHAGTIGGGVLLGTIYNFYAMKKTYDIAHPDWMIIAGLLLPLPMSLLAGKLVSMLLPPPPK